jgi:outer membrane protein
MLIRSTLYSLFAVASLAGGLYAQAATAQTPSNKVAVISVQGAIIGTKDGQKAAQELESKFAPKRKELTDRQTEITSLNDQLRKGSNTISQDKQAELQRQVEEKNKRLQRDTQDANEEWNTEQQRLLQSLGQRMMAVIEKYAKDNGYSMVLDVSNPNTPVLWASSALDITQDIISLYDKTSVNGGPAVTPGTTTPGATAPGTTAPGATVPPTTAPKPGLPASPSGTAKH